MGETQRTSVGGGPDVKSSNAISSAQPSSDGSVRKEGLTEEEEIENAARAAERGQAATDQCVHLSSTCCLWLVI